MADSASELESDCSSIDGTARITNAAQLQTASKELMAKRIESLQQECKVLKVELETYKLRCKNLVEENKNLRKASVSIQAKAEQEEEFISNMLLKKIQVLKKEKEALAMNYEQEEEFLTNDLSRKLTKLKQEKVQLERTLEQEQELQVNKLLKKIRKLEADTSNKQANLEQLRREKIELENTLEQEQEALVNKLWKRMEKLEAEKRLLQEKLDQPISEPPSPQPLPPNSSNTAVAPQNLNNNNNNNNNNKNEAAMLSRHVQQLKMEVAKLKKQLQSTRTMHGDRLDQINREERCLRHESQHIRQKFMEETAYARTLSESESSVDMDEDNRYMDHSPRSLKSCGSFSGAHPPCYAPHHSHPHSLALPPFAPVHNPLTTPRGPSTSVRNIPSPSHHFMMPSLPGGQLHNSRSVSPMNVVPTPGQRSALFGNSQHQHNHTCPHCGSSFPCPPSYPHHFNSSHSGAAAGASNLGANNQNSASMSSIHSLDLNLSNMTGNTSFQSNNLTPQSNSIHQSASNGSFNSSGIFSSSITSPLLQQHQQHSIATNSFQTGSLKTKRSPSADLFAKPPIPTYQHQNSVSNSASISPPVTANLKDFTSANQNLPANNPAALNPSNLKYKTPPGVPPIAGRDGFPPTLTKYSAVAGTKFKPLILKGGNNSANIGSDTPPSLSHQHHHLMTDSRHKFTPVSSNMLSHHLNAPMNEGHSAAAASNTRPIDISGSGGRNNVGGSRMTTSLEGVSPAFNNPQGDEIEEDYYEEDDEANKTPPSNKGAFHLVSAFNIGPGNIAAVNTAGTPTTDDDFLSPPSPLTPKKDRSAPSNNRTVT